MALIEAEPDITIAEMQERPRSEAGIAASVGTVWTFLDRAGLFSPGMRWSGLRLPSWSFVQHWQTNS